MELALPGLFHDSWTVGGAGLRECGGRRETCLCFFLSASKKQLKDLLSQAASCLFYRRWDSYWTICKSDKKQTKNSRIILKMVTGTDF